MKRSDIEPLRRTPLLLIVSAVLLLLAAAAILKYRIPVASRGYSAKDFGIRVLKSPVDFNGNGKDDYADFLAGARKDAENHPDYDSSYQDTGWPPDNKGVCADVIWRAFREAGYDLRAMVDADVAVALEDYPRIKKPDSNIDFRRVVNLKVFFEKYAQSLTLDPTEIAEWQPGDIVIFGSNKHIGIVSDRRNQEGICWIIHNGGQLHREEDYLSHRTMRITGHYRFDASAVPEELQIPWDPANEP
ncbi:MAG: DUF1287 domain-containing protein [Lachnospiraceae bacterium]|nr:DUF1287 domain-containing protein [Lachnospiraceae bacterium]MBQ9562612.1 DUF1287 domain-containing protein [Lachnospiraceae bacterium]